MALKVVGIAGGGVVGTATVAHGGTGRSTLTAHAVLIGEGTSPVNFAAPGVAGQALISNGATSDPTFQAITGFVTGTSLTSGQLMVGAGGSAIQTGDLSGDVTTSGSTATTVAKIQGTAVSAPTGTGAVVLQTSPTIITPVLSTANPMDTPKGRLTLVSATPVMTSDQTAKTTVYYTPYIGSIIPIYDGTRWSIKGFTELSMALDTSNQLLNNVYDLFVWNNSGTIAIGAGPAWNTNATITVTIAAPAVVSWTAHGLAEGDPVVFTTTGALPTGITAGTTYFVGRSPGTNSFNISTTVANAAAGTFITTTGTQSGTHTGTNHTKLRGTGSGTTELQQLNGIWTNKNSITLTNGAGGGTAGITANTATYVGSIFCTANGQTGMAFKPAAAGGGTNNVLGVWNAYNQVPTASTCRDNTGSWTYSTATWRASDGNVNNRITFLDGLGQSLGEAVFIQTVQSSATSTGVLIGAIIDATNTSPDQGAQFSAVATAAVTSRVQIAGLLGMHFAHAVEYATAATGTYYGTSNSNQQHQFSVRIPM